MSEHRILVPTDLTEFGAAALKYASALRGPLDAQLTVIHADEPGYPTAMPDLPLARLEPAPAEKENLLDELRKHVETHVPPPLPDLRIVSAFAVQAILEAAEEADASLIVMGTHGRRGWRRLMLGSVAENVLRESRRPVLTIGPEAARGEPRFATILCPVNFSPVAIDALREASAIASRMDADLTVLYVAERSKPPLTQELDREFAAWIDPQLRGRCRYRQLIVAGEAADAVLEIAAQTGADLLVVGAQHKRFRDATVIGSTSERIVRFATCPVLTVVRGVPAEQKSGTHAA